jgi:hypothetical protein
MSPALYVFSAQEESRACWSVNWPLLTATIVFPGWECHPVNPPSSKVNLATTTSPLLWILRWSKLSLANSLLTAPDPGDAMAMPAESAMSTATRRVASRDSSFCPCGHGEPTGKGAVHEDERWASWQGGPPDCERMLTPGIGQTREGSEMSSLRIGRRRSRKPQPLNDGWWLSPRGAALFTPLQGMALYGEIRSGQNVSFGREALSSRRTRRKKVRLIGTATSTKRWASQPGLIQRALTRVVSGSSLYRNR